MNILLRPTVMELPAVGTNIIRNNRLQGIVDADKKTGQPILYIPAPSSLQQVVFQLVTDEEHFCFFCHKKLTNSNSNVDHLVAQRVGGPSIYKLRPMPYTISAEDVLKGHIDTSNVDVNLIEPVTNCHRTCKKCNNLKNSVDEESFDQALLMIDEGTSIDKVKKFIRNTERQQYDLFIKSKSINNRLAPIVSKVPCDLIKDTWYTNPDDFKRSRQGKCKRFYSEHGFFRELVILDRNMEVVSGRLVVRFSEEEGIEAVNAVIISNVEINPAVFCGKKMVTDN